MKEDPKSGRMTASFEELANSNMLVVESLVQWLVEKGLITRTKMKTRVIKLKSETKVNPTKLPAASPST